MKPEKQWRTVDKWIFASVFLYVVACLTPTGCHFEYGGDVVLGFLPLLLGWLTVFGQFGFFLIWCSNILYFIAIADLALKGARNLTVLLSMIALLLAMSWFCVCSFLDSTNECHVGYYFWVTSYLVLFIATLKFWFRKTKGLEQNKKTD